MARTDEGPPRDWTRTVVCLASLLVLLSLPDLLSPPVSPTIFRQTQTYDQTVNFAASGFSPHGLAIDIDGSKPFGLALEFPIYQAIVGALFKVFGPSFFLGKLVSLAATVAGFLAALRLARIAWGGQVATRAGLILAACPITLLLSAAFQPDALALALGAFGGLALLHWKERPGLGRWIVFLLTTLAAALTKFPVLVPFIPLVIYVIFTRDGRLRLPAFAEWLTAIVLFVVPFVAWNLYRATLTDPRFAGFEGSMFFFGDLSRFLRPGYYFKPGFILGAMVLCGAGVPLALLGLRKLDRATALLFAGVPFYFVLIATAAEQTYYALPVAPALCLLAARGTLWLEGRFQQARKLAVTVIAAAWVAGFAIAAPYTIRHDDVSLDAARAVESVSKPGDLLLVANMHDRGVGVGGFNPTILTLSDRRGWNVPSSQPTSVSLVNQAGLRRNEGAKWMVVTWFIPEEDPWFGRFLPASFSRCPRFNGVPVDGKALAEGLAEKFPVAARGDGYMVLALQ